MIRQSVRSDNGDREGKWVALCIAIILIIACVLLPYHQVNTTQTSLAAHQIAITDLSADELAMVAELRLAHEEIRNLHQDTAGVWPQLNELQEYWIAPFVEDKSWERKGRHQWTMIADGVYQGIRSNETGAMSVILNSHHASPDIWLAATSNTTAWQGHRQEPINEKSLIDNAWTQIVFEQTPHSDSATHAH